MFGENKENITQSFVSDIIGEKIEIIDIKTDSTLARKYPTEKAGRLDLKTKFKDGTICQIEMQMSDDKDIIKRILYYWSKTYSKQLKRGENYKDLNKTIGILITNYEIKELREKWELDERSAIRNAIDENTMEIAKKLKSMNMKVEDIQKATGLTEEEIDKL